MPAFNKKVIPHEKFYVVSFFRDENAPYLVFIHGGPGLNCGVLEYLIEHKDYFEALNCNILLYDQRGCGRSREYFKNMDGVSHADNVNDLGEIIDYLGSMNLDVKGLIGHSYGAKVLFDFIEKTGANIPSIFVATGDSILTPRLNNITLDLAYLKKTNPEKYKSVLEKMDRFDLNSLWAITEELATVFQENQDRHYFYWANLEVWEKCKGVQGKVQLPISSDVFESVRKDLYSSESNFSVDIASLAVSTLWVNGVHDYIINGLDNIFSMRNEIVNFYKSSHYPHIEENDVFCKLVNDFMNN